MRKPTVTYNKNTKTAVLKFLVYENNPRLFLEWLMVRDRTGSGRITFSVSTLMMDESEILNDLFVIKFDNITQEDANNVKDYIALNS